MNQNFFFFKRKTIHSLKKELWGFFPFVVPFDVQKNYNILVE